MIAEKYKEELISKFQKTYSTWRLLCSPFLLSVFFLVLLLFFFTPIYEVNDDVSMLRMVSGTYFGGPNPLMVYINPILGIVLALLFNNFPNISWYGFFLYSLLFFTLYLNLKLILASPIDRTLKILFILYLLPFYFYSFLYVQYTLVSGLLYCCGIILLASFYLNRIFLSFVWVVIGIFLIIVSALLRWDVLCYFGFMSLPLIVFFWKQKSRPLLFIIIACLLVINFIGKNIYSQKPEWNDYMKWSNIQKYFSDYNFTEYERNQNLYQIIKWSQNDYLMMSNWFYTDESVFSTEKLENILKGAFINNLSFQGLVFTAKYLFFQLYYHSLVFPIFIFFQFILFLVLSKEQRLFQVKLLTIFFIFLIFLSSAGRIAPSRIIYPLFIAIPLFILIIKPKTVNLNNILLPYLMLGLAAFGLLYFVYYGNMAKNNSLAVNNFDKILQLLPKNSLIFNWDSSLPLEWTKVFDNPQKFSDYDIAGTGWPQKSPYDLSLFYKYQITDLYREIIDNPKVYLVVTDKYLDYYRQYLLEHYQITVRFNIVVDFGPYEIKPRYGYGAKLVQIFSDDINK